MPENITDKHSQELCFYIFDIIDFNLPFSERLVLKEKIMQISYDYKLSTLQWVTTTLVETIPKIQENLTQFTSLGFEGLMLRDPNGLYKMNRSNNLLKFKTFIDAEFKVVDFKEGTKADKGTVIWVCTSYNNILFNVRPKGTLEERSELFKNAHDYVGRMLTVRYQELTDKGVPRFPVGIGFRDNSDLPEISSVESNSINSSSTKKTRVYKSAESKRRAEDFIRSKRNFKELSDDEFKELRLV